MAKIAEPADCVDKLLEEFKLYDRTVDIVSCWEFLFTKVEPFATGALHFDRFPRLQSPESAGQPKTPDFAALLSDSYGIVADVKGGFPRDEASFLSHARRLLKYDCPLNFRTAQGNALQPTTHDILLVIPLRDAQEIVARLERLRGSGEFQSEASVIAVEWIWDADRNEYVFRKVSGQPSGFRDDALPGELRLSGIFGERGASLKISPDKIKTIKATWQFCNDAPPPIYTLVFLWTKILYHLLNSSQRSLWRRRDPRKALWIDLTLESLVTEIRTRYPMHWGHWTDWVSVALDVLVASGLAKKTGADRFAVGYRNLARELGESRIPAGDVAHPREYARILATYICKASIAGGSAEGALEKPSQDAFNFGG